VRFAAFRDVRNILSLADKGGKFFRKAGKYLPNYMASRRGACLVQAGMSRVDMTECFAICLIVPTTIWSWDLQSKAIPQQAVEAYKVV
jgi:hypothetical protein